MYIRVLLIILFSVHCLIAQCQIQPVKTYKSTSIGKQVWMAENLSEGRFRNGDYIPQAKNAAEWKAAGIAKKPIWAWYKYNPANKTMGRFYNYFAVSDKRGLAPQGWHIPDSIEWYTLIAFLGKDSSGYKLKSVNGWNDDLHKKGCGNNSTGFNGEPFSFLQGGEFYGYGNAVCYWQTCTDYQDNAWYFELWFVQDDIVRMGNIARKQGWSKTDGVFVRCVKD